MNNDIELLNEEESGRIMEVIDQNDLTTVDFLLLFANYHNLEVLSDAFIQRLEDCGYNVPNKTEEWRVEVLATKNRFVLADIRALQEKWGDKLSFKGATFEVEEVAEIQNIDQLVTDVDYEEFCNTLLS